MYSNALRLGLPVSKYGSCGPSIVDAVFKMLGELWWVLQAKLRELEEDTLVSYTPPKLFTSC